MKVLGLVLQDAQPLVSAGIRGDQKRPFPAIRR